MAASKKARPAKRGRSEAVGERLAAERQKRFNKLVQGACLRAGAVAGISTISAKVPVLGRLAPLLLGTIAEAATLAKIQQQLVRDTLELYEMELDELERQGVVLLATAANLGAQQLSRRTLAHLVFRFGGPLSGRLVARVLPLAALLAEVAASIASTYAVGKRTQALCEIRDGEARNLAELLRGLTGIDERRLLSWTGEALQQTLQPFRRALGSLELGPSPAKSPRKAPAKAARRPPPKKSTPDAPAPGKRAPRKRSARHKAGNQ